MQRHLYEMEQKSLAAQRQREVLDRLHAAQVLDEVSGSRVREFREADTRVVHPWELTGALGDWLRERRQGDRVPLSED